MKKIKRTVALFCAMLILLISANVAAQEQDEISVYVNGAKVDFGVNKPFIKNSKTLAPARDVFGSVGAEIEWDNDTQTVTVRLGGKTLTLTIGNTQVTYATSEGTKQLKSEVAPEIINSSTYVPIRLIAEGLGADLEWVISERAAYLTFDSAEPSVTEAALEPEETPAVSKKPTETIKSRYDGIYEISGITLDMVLSGEKTSFGDKAEELTPANVKLITRNESVYGYSWQDINAGTDSYALIGSDVGKITAFYSNSRKARIGGITPGMTASRMNSVLGAELPLERKTVIESDDGRLTIFRSSLKGYSVIAVMAQKTGYTTPLNKITTSQFTVPTERQLMNIINTERYNQRAAALTIDERLSMAARSHSESMSKGNYLSTTDTEGKTALDRINESVGEGSLMASESIARDVIDAIEVFHVWMNELTDSANITYANYKHLGVGVSPCPNGHKMYFTVDFVEK